MLTTKCLRPLVLALFLLPQFARATTWIVQVGPGGGRTFSPDTVTVAPGDTVEWDWASSPHSVTSGTGTPDGLFDSGVHGVPFTYTRVFPSVGSFPYYCTIHGTMMSGTVNVVSPTPVPDTPTPPPTATPTPNPVTIAGTISYCFGNQPTPGPVPSVTMTLTGSASATTVTDSSGHYQFSGLPSGGNYTVTPSKSPIPVGTNSAISTVDAIAIQRHFLGIFLQTGCRLTAADTNHSTTVDTTDVITVTRYFIQLMSGTADVGKYQFSPTTRSYTTITNDQTNENYNALVFGDVAGTPVHRPDGAGER